jgi:hypothetical protein
MIHYLLFYHWGLRVPVAMLFVYWIPFLGAAWPTAWLLRKSDAFAHKAFHAVRAVGREKLLLGLIAVMQLSTFVAQRDAWRPDMLTILRIHVGANLLCAIGVWAIMTAALFSYVDDGGFRIETKTRRRAGIHVHRLLDKEGQAAFKAWLPHALMHCADMGMDKVDLESPLLRKKPRRERLAARIAAISLAPDGAPVLMTVRKSRTLPLMWPGAWSYWRKFGQYRTDVANWPRWKRVRGRVWWRQAGITVTVKRVSGDMSGTETNRS